MAQVGVLTCTTALRCGQAHQLGAEAQGTTATGSLDRAHSLGRENRVVAAEDQFFHGLVEGCIARRGYIGLGSLARQDRLFGLADAIQDRGLPFSVPKHPNAQIHLLGVGIGAKRRHQAKNRVIRHAVKTLKHGYASLEWNGGRKCTRADLSKSKHKRS